MRREKLGKIVDLSGRELDQLIVEAHNALMRGSLGELWVEYIKVVPSMSYWGELRRGGECHACLAGCWYAYHYGDIPCPEGQPYVEFLWESRYLPPEEAMKEMDILCFLDGLRYIRLSHLMRSILSLSGYEVPEKLGDREMEHDTIGIINNLHAFRECNPTRLGEERE